MAERSRMKRYENLRRKINDLSYFSLERSKTTTTVVYTPDPDPEKAPKPSSSAVRHNTMTIPISQIQEETDREQGITPQHTQQFKAVDESDRPGIKRGRTAGLKPLRRLSEDWWKWLLIALGCLAVAAAIIVVAVVFAP